MDILLYRIHHLLKTDTAFVKYKNARREINDRILDNSEDNPVISLDGKKNQLFDQLISDVIAHFTTCRWEKNGQKITGDILRELSGENGRRNLYGTLIQDSRRR